jgi:LmbE family N-acetylglucosaminyl deacetylase
MTAMNYRDNQNQLITNVLKQHSVKTLVGYSAQVEAIKLNNLSNINILPMQNCFQPITLLQNTQWQPELKDASFAYIFSLQQTNDGYTNCSFQQFEKIYGEPNSQVLISGSVANPKAFLFFYNKGFHKLPVLKKTSIRSIINNVAPLPLAVLTAPTCSGATTLVMVAHEDDDLLFMNPDINSQIQSGDCVRVVYLTAGDDGGAAFYWLDRQEGSETAYSTMIGQMNNWIERTVEIAPNEYATLATPSDNSKVSLLFMHLPDGNLAGQGFKTYGYQSIHKLYSGTIGTINSVDGQSHYTKPQLTGALSTIINFYKPNQLWTQSSYVDSSADHSDHGTTGKFATAAVLGSNNTSLSTTYYMGYQMNALPSDLNQTDQSNKQTIFKQYAEHDPNICEGTTLCLNLSTYKNYIFREYTWAY